MKINNVTAATYWSKPRKVEAVRLADANLEKIADFLGAELCIKSGKEPFINYGGDEGYAGEWLVQTGEDTYDFYSDEDFLKRFWTHDERMASDEKYAKIYILVSSAMAKQDAATYNQDQNGMDLIAIETVQKIIGEL
jgi:hypothetical protein